MNSGRSDASTSTDTDELKGRPLCLFYFTHPFGVLSPEPPLLAAPPPHVARAFLNMQPVPPCFWGSTPDYNTASSASDASSAAPPTRLNYDLGKATVHKNPVNIVSVSRTRKCTIDLGSGRDTISSSIFSSDVWFSSGSSGRSYEYSRRLIPYHRILPPLQLPPPRDSSSLDSSDDVWPSKRVNPEKFSLPPIELPVCSTQCSSYVVTTRTRALCEVSSAESGARARGRRRLGGVRARRGRLSGARRLLAGLARRALRGAGALRLQDALATLRDAWAAPRSLRARCRRAVTQSSEDRDLEQALSVRRERAHERTPSMPHHGASHGQRPEPAPRGGASPGLLRRRYSVPETIMRKYRLAQQRSESEAGGASSASPASASPPSESPRAARLDRELMRKSALMRRLWGRAAPACCDACDGGRETRSLDTSRSELRPLSCCSAPPRPAPAAPPSSAGWATPKRQRLDSTRDFRGSDEMLRTAMRNSYDRAEELRCDLSKHDLSDSTRSFGREVSSCIESLTEALTASDGSNVDDKSGRKEMQHSQIFMLDSSTMEIDSSSGNRGTLEYIDYRSSTQVDENSLTDTSESYSASMLTTKENNAYVSSRPHKQISSSAHIEGRISERSASVENDDTNVLPYDTPLCVDTPPYELLEIVVSESLNSNSISNNKCSVPDNRAVQSVISPASNHWRKMQNINIDEYVSNILVESLNSLTDQIECMNASIGNDRKVSIVEKEIKVKLQNTGVNTIVHLSPMSNNQIIFGNEELCNGCEDRDGCNNNNPRDSLGIREEAPSAETNNNPPTAPSPRTPPTLHSPGSPQHDPVFSVMHNDNVNRAVLQQIQKLFQDELKSLDESQYIENGMPGISHIEFSNVDVYIANHEAAVARAAAADAVELGEVISGVGAGNYFPDGDDAAVVPRFSALPHTDSMEVNTSSSDDPDQVGSDCTSLVDSLDDPNSPRSVFLRKAFNNNKRNELVRSAIDVLDLLPENSYNNYKSQPKDKGEAFFIRIRDNNLDCEKENVIVAEHMPEKIKQRLFRRHRKREMRMECARRSKVKQMKRELEQQSARDVERDCQTLADALLDDVIGKMARDELQCLRLRKSSRMAARSDESLSKRTWKKDVEYFNHKKASQLNKNTSSSSSAIDADKRRRKSDGQQIRGKLSLLAHPPLSPESCGPRRIYQKSEIREGNKCIEILEILEYVNSSQSQSSPDNTNSDENQNGSSRYRKSRIPVPVYEKIQKISSDSSKSYKTSACKRTSPCSRGDSQSSQLLTDMLLQVLGEERPEATPPARRASVPAYEPRSRSNSLRFKQMFDIIPEERSSLSLDSGGEDASYGRRASAPNVADASRIPQDDNNVRINSQNQQNEMSEALRSTVIRDYSRKPKETRNTGTSPLSSDGDKKKNSQLTMTSPNRKSAATSPIRVTAVKSPKQSNATSSTTSQTTSSSGASGKRALASRGRGWLGFTRPDYKLHEEGSKERDVEKEAPKDRQAGSPVRRRGESQRTVRTILSEVIDPIIVVGDKHRSQKSKTRRRTERDNSKADEGKTKKRGSRLKDEGREEQDAAGAGSAGGEEARVRLPACARSRSSSGSSGSARSLLCALAPKWLSAPARRRHAARRAASHAPQDDDDEGGWSVTVAGSCRAALPADVEMRLRFPPDAPPALHPAHRPHLQRAATHEITQEEWSCVSRRCPQCACACCAGAAPAPAAPLRPPPLPPAAHPSDSRLTLTMKKEALGSSVLASKTAKKSSDPLPDLETYTASRSKLKSSVKTRRGCSLHCWLPDDEPALLRTSEGLSVLGSAIVPELKPRARTMSERDLTRCTPRHYLRC